MTREQIEGLIKVLSGPDLYTIAHIRAIAPSAAAALRTLQERCKSLERVNAALNDTIDHLENVVAEWRGDRTT